MRVSVTAVALVAVNLFLAQRAFVFGKRFGDVENHSNHKKNDVKTAKATRKAAEIADAGADGFSAVETDLFTETMGNPQHCSLGEAISGNQIFSSDLVSYGQPYIMGLPHFDLCPYFDAYYGFPAGTRRRLEDGERQRVPQLAFDGHNNNAGRKLWTPNPTNQQLAQSCTLPILKATEPGTCKVKFGPEHIPMLTQTPLPVETSQVIVVPGDNYITDGSFEDNNGGPSLNDVANFGPCPASTKCPCIDGQMFEPGCHGVAVCNTTAWDGSAELDGMNQGQDPTMIGELPSGSTVDRNPNGDNMMELLFKTNITVKVVHTEKPMIGCRAGVPLKLPIQGNCKASFKPNNYISAMDNCGTAKTFCYNKFPGQTCANKAAIDPLEGTGTGTSTMTFAYTTKRDFLEELYNNGIPEDEIPLIQGTNCFVCFALDSRENDHEGNPIYSFRDAHLSNEFYKDVYEYPNDLVTNNVFTPPIVVGGGISTSDSIPPIVTTTPRNIAGTNGLPATTPDPNDTTSDTAQLGIYDNEAGDYPQYIAKVTPVTTDQTYYLNAGGTRVFSPSSVYYNAASNTANTATGFGAFFIDGSRTDQTAGNLYTNPRYYNLILNDVIFDPTPCNDVGAGPAMGDAFYVDGAPDTMSDYVTTATCQDGSLFQAGNQGDAYVPISIPSEPCLVEVSVEDSTGPGIKNCPLVNLPPKVPTTGDQCGYAVDFTLVQGGDECSPNGGGIFTECKIDTFGEAPGSYQYTSMFGTQFLKPGKHTVTCKATDISGNEGIPCTDTIEVYDPEAPELKCPATTMVPMDYGECFATFSGSDALAIRAQDECGLDDWAGLSCKNVENDDDIPVEKVVENGWRSIDSAQAYIISPTYEFPEGLTMVECQTKDKSTNTASCYFSINVMDTKNWCEK